MPHCSFELIPDSQIELGVIHLQRPDAKNAINQPMLIELTALLHNLREQTTLRGLLIASSVPGIFCSGADLKERQGFTHDQVIGFLDAFAQCLEALEALPFPTVALMEGNAFGGGLELALACDFRIAQPTAQMGFTETTLGIIPGAGGTQRLARLIGYSRAKKLVFSGMRLTADEALPLGIVDEVFPSNEVRSRAISYLMMFGPAAPLAIGAAKQAFRLGADLPLTEALTQERKAYLTLLNTEDRQEGLKAFKEKRRAVFKGK